MDGCADGTIDFPELCLYTLYQGRVHMMIVSASRLRKELFTILDDVSNGQSVQITRHGEVVATISHSDPLDWRQRVRVEPKLKKDPIATFAPLDEEWSKYL